MSLAYLGFGSNLGDKVSLIEKGIAEITSRGIGTVLRISRMYQTEPIGVKVGGDFINCAVETMTDLEPRELLAALRDIEESMGRERTRDKNSPRTLDIDILLYDYIVINEADLAIPHPEIPRRHFLLRTLNDIRPDLLHPGRQQTMAQLLETAEPDVLKQRVVAL